MILWRLYHTAQPSGTAFFCDFSLVLAPNSSNSPAFIPSARHVSRGSNYNWMTRCVLSHLKYTHLLCRKNVGKWPENSLIPVESFVTTKRMGKNKAIPIFFHFTKSSSSSRNQQRLEFIGNKHILLTFAEMISVYWCPRIIQYYHFYKTRLVGK